MASTNISTLSEFIIESEDAYPEATGALTRILSDIAIASKIVHREINKAGLVDILGAAGSENIQGEQVQKLDLYANDQFIAALQSGGEVAAIASEEDDDIVVLEGRAAHGKYLVCMDPLDGSSNIDVNISVGTIFSIYKRDDNATGPVTRDEFYKKGSEQVVGGYVIYGSSTMLVYTTGKGVNGFTLDPSIGEFCLSHPNIKTPSNGGIYSINEGNINSVSQGIKDYVNFCQQLNEAGKRTHTARFMGSLVADFHRNLLKGGIFIYPATADAPKGKLRLLYECNPIAFIAEQAGAKATDGTMRVLDIEPTELHQRTPFFTGSPEMMDKAASFLEE